MPLKFGKVAWGATFVYKVIRSFRPWSLLAVYMLGVLLSLVKLLDLARVEPGVSMYAFALLIVTTLLAFIYFDPQAMWEKVPFRDHPCPS